MISETRCEDAERVSDDMAEQILVRSTQRLYTECPTLLMVATGKRFAQFACRSQVLIPS